MTVIQLREAKIEYDLRKATGKSRGTIVAVNGWTEDKEMWKGQKGLASTYDLLSFNPRGVGSSSGEIRREVYLDDSAQDMLDLCIKLGIEKPHVLGHSMGALIALKYTKTASDKYYPGSLALVTPVLGNPNDTVASGNFIFTMNGKLNALLNIYIKRKMHRNEWLGADAALEMGLKILGFFGDLAYRIVGVPKDVREEFTKFFANARITGVKPRLSGFFGMRNEGPDIYMDLEEGRILLPQKTLVVVGRQDIIVDCEGVLQIVRSLERRLQREIKTEVMHYSGHFPFSENPHLFNTILREFLDIESSPTNYSTLRI